MKDWDYRTVLYLSVAGVMIAIIAKTAWSCRNRPLVNRIVACLGDSITLNGGYVRELASRLGKSSIVKAFGYKGEGIVTIKNHLAEVLAIHPTDLVVLAGVNDLSSDREPSTIIKNLDYVYKTAQANKVRVIAIAITPWACNSIGKLRTSETQIVNNWIKLSSSADAVVGTSVLGDSHGCLLKGFDSGDGLHLNSEGHSLLGKLLYERGFA